MTQSNEDTLHQILNRVSVPRLMEPGPNEEQLKLILQAALRAPDHMRLRPWRFLTITGEARQSLGKALKEAALLDDPNLEEAKAEKCLNMPMRAPVLIAAIAENRQHPKVPHLEEEISCGVGMGYMLLAAETLGYGAMWRTGPLNYHPHIHQTLGVEDGETLVGFLYIGTPNGERKRVPELDVADFVTEWMANS